MVNSSASSSYDELTSSNRKVVFGPALGETAYGAVVTALAKEDIKPW